MLRCSTNNFKTYGGEVPGQHAGMLEEEEEGRSLLADVRRMRQKWASFDKGWRPSERGSGEEEADLEADLLDRSLESLGSTRAPSEANSLWSVATGSTVTAKPGPGNYHPDHRWVGKGLSIKPVPHR